MTYRNNNEGGAGFLFLLLLGFAVIAGVVVVILKVLPVLWRVVVALTQVLLPLGSRMFSATLGWPGEDGEMAPSTAALIGGALMGILAFITGFLLWLLAGLPFSVVILAVATGALLGIVAGASSRPRSNARVADSIEDFTRW